MGGTVKLMGHMTMGTGVGGCVVYARGVLLLANQGASFNNAKGTMPPSQGAIAFCFSARMSSKP